jgi:hypothetical protein
MAKRSGIVEKSYLLGVPVPQQTKTYTPIPHLYAMDITLKKLSDKNFILLDEIYRCNNSGLIAQGNYILSYSTDEDLNMMVGWSNSYDKSCRFRFIVGAYIKESKSYMISGTLGTWDKVHRGNADKLTIEQIEHQVNNANKYYQQLVNDKNVMKTVAIDMKIMSIALGEIYLKYNLITDEQVSMIKQIVSKDPKSVTNLWQFYNAIVISLQKSHPKNWIDQQISIHYYICNSFNIVNQTLKFEEDVNDEKVEELLVE